MENPAQINTSPEKNLVEHPIVDFYLKEVLTDSVMCPCADYEVCDYDAN